MGQDRISQEAGALGAPALCLAGARDGLDAAEPCKIGWAPWAHPAGQGLPLLLPPWVVSGAPCWAPEAWGCEAMAGMGPPFDAQGQWRPRPSVECQGAQGQGG